MAISVFDLFTIGVGPSSSHTVGPMRAGKRFVDRLAERGLLSRVGRIEVELFGSLALTGRGHGTDKAVLAGLAGAEPESVATDWLSTLVDAVAASGELAVSGRGAIAFDVERDLLFRRRKTLPYHPNGMRFRAFDGDAELLLERTFYSVGGGFVVNDEEASEDRIVPDATAQPYPFSSGDELLEICRREGVAIWQLMLANETVWRSEAEVRSGLLTIAAAMRDCVEAGCQTEGVLPGGLGVERRAPGILRDLEERGRADDPLAVLDRVSLYAIAVNEENAAGGRVVTAPTNGAAGILPAVLEYYRRFVADPDDAEEQEDGVVRFLLTAAAIGILFKKNASISGAEVGCQGEVGVACSMAAGALAEVLGGSPAQVENAAEIGMEHNLGLTCDPINGLVQIPCIERNAVGAVKAISAARLALRGDGGHKVSLDKVIRTMRETGADMKTKYKETSRGGLALNVIEC